MSNAHQKAIDDFKQELELSTDMTAIVHLLTSPHWGNKEHADLLGSALVGYEGRYGRDLLRDLENDIQQLLGIYAEKIVEGEYDDGV
jgi:hypothetical protein